MAAQATERACTQSQSVASGACPARAAAVREAPAGGACFGWAGVLGGCADSSVGRGAGDNDTDGPVVGLVGEGGVRQIMVRVKQNGIDGASFERLSNQLDELIGDVLEVQVDDEVVRAEIRDVSWTVMVSGNEVQVLGIEVEP